MVVRNCFDYHSRQKGVKAFGWYLKQSKDMGSAHRTWDHLRGGEGAGGRTWAGVN